MDSTTDKKVNTNNGVPNYLQNQKVYDPPKPVIKTKDFVASEYGEDEFNKFADLYEKTFNVIKENEIVKGKIVAISDADV